MHVDNCKRIQCAESDDVCYTGQMWFGETGYKNYVRGCADSSIVKSECDPIGEILELGFKSKSREL